MLEKINAEVIKQLKAREAIFGKKVNRTEDDLHFLSSRNSWVRLISSVDTGAENQSNRNPNLQGPIFRGSPTQAKKFILSSPVNYTSNGLKKRSDILIQGDTGLYNFTDTTGIRPAPGITGFKIISKNRYGTIREATVDFKVWSVDDINAIEELYFHPGFSAIVEWGHTLYVDNSGKIEYTPAFDTRLDDFFSQKKYQEIENIISENKIKHNFNYDAFIGYIKNFSWSFNNEGGYDCSVSIISLGEVLDSLTTKLPPVYTSIGNTIELRETKKYKTILHQFVDEINYDYINISGPAASQANKTVFTVQDLRYTKDLLLKEFPQYNEQTVIAVKVFIDTNAGQRVSYITLRTLLGLLNTRYSIIYNTEKCESSEKAVSFDTRIIPDNRYTTFDEHFSLDPKIGILPNKPDFNKVLKINQNFTESIYNLPPGFNVDNLSEYIMPSYNGFYDIIRQLTTKQVGILDSLNCLNILVSLDSVIESAEKFTSQDGDNFEFAVSDFVRDILNKINTALGNVTELDLAAYDDSGRLFSIIDRKFLPKITTQELDYQIPITGLRSQITNLNVNSKISNKLGSMISIAAQAVENNNPITKTGTGDESLWERYNAGLVDRHIRDAQVGYSRKCVTPPDEEQKADTEINKVQYTNISLGQTLGGTAQIPSSPQTPQQSLTTYSTYDFQELTKFVLLAGSAYKDFVWELTRSYNQELFDVLKNVGQKFFKLLSTQFIYRNEDNPKGIIPVELSFTVDGIGGLKIGNIFTIDSRLIPQKFNNYGYIIVGLDHSIENQRWKTNIRAQTFLLGKDIVPNNTGGIPGPKTISPGQATIFEPDTNLPCYQDAYNNVKSRVGDLNQNDWKLLISAIYGEASSNAKERAYVAGVILNRMNIRRKTVTGVLYERNQFQAVTGASDLTARFRRGPSKTEEGEIYCALATYLKQVPGNYQYFVSNNDRAYIKANGQVIGNINAKYCMLCKPHEIIGQTIFGPQFGDKECVDGSKYGKNLKRKPC
jgi:hypothetical protein